MLIRSSLLAGPKIQLEFYAAEDLRPTESGGEKLHNLARLTLLQDEARAILEWLRGDRSTDHQGSNFTVRGVMSGLTIESNRSPVCIYLGESEVIESLRQEVEGALALIIGQPVPAN
jgi:hypothetical protein